MRSCATVSLWFGAWCRWPWLSSRRRTPGSRCSTSCPSSPTTPTPRWRTTPSSPWASSAQASPRVTRTLETSQFSRWFIYWFVSDLSHLLLVLVCNLARESEVIGSQIAYKISFVYKWPVWITKGFISVRLFLACSLVAWKGLILCMLGEVKLHHYRCLLWMVAVVGLSIM